MQPIKAEELTYLQKIKGLFIGDPSFKYIFELPKPQVLQPSQAEVSEQNENTEEKNEEEKNEESEKKPEKPKEPTSFKVLEESRLSFVISCIDHDTSVAPRGSSVLKSNNEVFLNDTFQGICFIFLLILQGLSHKEAMQLKNYLHMRRPEKIQFQTLLQKEYLSKSLDFADTIDEDVPNSM